MIKTRPGADAIVLSMDRSWQKIRASIEEYGREMYEAGRSEERTPLYGCSASACFCIKDAVSQADGAGEEFIMGPESCS